MHFPNISYILIHLYLLQFTSQMASTCCQHHKLWFCRSATLTQNKFSGTFKRLITRHEIIHSYTTIEEGGILGVCRALHTSFGLRKQGSKGRKVSYFDTVSIRASHFTPKHILYFTSASPVFSHKFERNRL